MVFLSLSKLLSDEIASAEWDIESASRSGGQSFTGVEQILINPAARWVCTLTINVFTRQDDLSALAFRSLKSKLRGRDRTILIPDVERRGPAWMAGIVPDQVPFADGALFSDGSDFSQFYATAGFIGPHAMNATTVSIRLVQGLSLLPGQRFSTPDGRMYEISDLLSWDGSTDWQVEIWPWLRDDYGDGTSLDFDNPHCLMKLAKDKTGSLTVSTNPVDVPSIDLVEAV